eukprot:212783-Chlamydomonas_euryale.AAC.1
MKCTCVWTCGAQRADRKSLTATATPLQSDTGPKKLTHIAVIGEVSTVTGKQGNNFVAPD